MKIRFVVFVFLGFVFCSLWASVHAYDEPMQRVPLPDGMSMPAGFEAWMLEPSYALGNVFFDPEGKVYIFSNEIGTRKLIRTDQVGRVTTYAENDLLAGVNLKSGTSMDASASSIMMTVDFWPDGGNAYGGLFKLKSDSTFSSVSTAQGHGGLADLLRAPKAALFIPAPLPQGLSMPEGMTAVAARSNYTMGPVGSIFFNDTGDLFAITRSKNRQRIAKIDAAGNASVFADNAVLKGANWKSGAALGSSVLVAMDYAPWESPYYGIYQIDPDGTTQLWPPWYGGLFDIIPKPGGGFYFSDFEADNVYFISNKVTPETALISSGAPPALTSLAYDVQTATLYVLNRPEGGGWPFGGENAIYKIEEGKAVKVADAPAGAYFAGIAFSVGGIFGNNLYATDYQGGRIFRIESNGAATPVITGLTKPEYIRFNPATGHLLVVSDSQYLIWFGSTPPAIQTVAASAGWYFTDFENDNVWYISGEGQPEVGILESNIPPGLSMLAYNDTDDFLYAVNWTGGWPFGGDKAVYRIEGNGTAVAIATATSGANEFTSIAMSKGGPFGNHLYATDSSGGRIVRLENANGVWSVVDFITGLPTPSFLKFSPTTGEMIVVCNGGKNVLWVGTKVPAELERLVVSVIAPKIVTPGQEVTFLVRYLNGMDKTAEDVVITLDIPREFNYLSSTGGGIYRNDWNQVFWKLGNLDRGVSGTMAVQMIVPWGLPNSEGRILANIGARNAPNSYIDIDSYLNFVARAVLSHVELTESEISTLLVSNPRIKQLYDFVIKQGYLFHNTAVRTSFSDGTTVDVLFFLEPEGYGPAFLISDGKVVFIEEHNKGMYKIFDTEGGYQRRIDGDFFHSWGAWSESHSLSEAWCQVNCTMDKVPNWVLSAVSDEWKNLQNTKNCTLCAYSKGEDPVACAKCANGIVQKYKKIPGVSYVIDVMKCLSDCLDNPNSHMCTKDKRECGTSILGWLGGFDTVYITPCNTTFRTYGALSYRIFCAIGEKCVNGECGGKDPCKENPASCQEKKIIVRTARDPNAKSIDFQGNVLPGQELTYTIEYENVGAGTAYEVFVIDQLDTDLDETTLVVNNGGTYSASPRLLSWDVGTLPPCTPEHPDICKGSVSFSVNVKNGLPSGTEITNYAEVHFPSAMEITPTNPVLNIVKSIAADPKGVETLSGIPVAITLTGRDAGAHPLAYRVTAIPLYGEITGTPPNITYTSMAEFSGQDEFYYVVNNGLIDSDPARVTIRVNPNPSDVNPPTVIETYPVSGATNVHVNPLPLSTNPDQYIPIITATFSEPVDSTTLTPTSFSVDGLTGNVLYDEVTKTASFIPSVPLSNSTIYTARLTTEVKDKVGNAMVSDYTWQFTTASLINISVTLSENASEFDFGETFVNDTSLAKIVNITSTGISDLSVGEIGRSGTNPNDFIIVEDKCSEKTLSQFENCTVKVAFKPLSGGMKEAVLSIPSNAPDTPMFHVPLKGTGLIRKYLLSVSLTGTGSGLVTSSPPGIDCGSDCEEEYEQDTVVTLGASPSPRSVFTGWSGACSGTGECTIIMNSPMNVAAHFTYIPSIPLPFFDDFSTEKGWIGYEVGGWERGPAEEGGGEFGYPDPEVDHTPFSVDNYLLGFAIGGDYPNNLSERSIISPPIDCKDNDRVYLRFWGWLNVEGYDRATIHVSNDGTNWSLVWVNPVYDITDDQWFRYAFDISSIAANQEAVYIKFTMGPTDDSYRYSGWNIDDLEVTSNPIDPHEGTIGTVFTIYGTDFGDKKGKILVGDIAAKVLEWTNERIHCLLSKVPLPGVYNVKVIPKVPKGASPILFEAGFKVRSPQIDRVEPASGSPGDQITIYGGFFGKGKGKVYIGTQACKVITWGMDDFTGESMIVCTVPKKLVPGRHDIKVTNKIGSDTCTECFEME